MDGPASPTGFRFWLGHGLEFVALLVAYRLLVATDDPAEWAAGAIASAVATSGSVAVARQLPTWRVRWGWVARVGPMVARVPIDGIRVTLAAFRREVPAGTFAVVPIDPGGDDAESAGRRGLVIAAASLAPNGVVVIVDRLHRALLIHRLVPERGPAVAGDRQADPEWPA